MAGCAGYRPPSIQLADVRLSERSSEAAALEFDLVLENPNAEPIELREFRYSLSLDGRHVYEGRRAAFTTLHPGVESRITLPGVVRFDSMGWADDALPPAADYRLSGNVMYVTPGALAEILLDTGVRRPKTGFTRRGRLEFVSGP